MLAALSMKNKIPFIDGSLPKPAATDPTYDAWTRGNNVVIYWLYNSVSKDIITSILFTNTAKEICDDLKTKFSRKNGPRIFQLRRQLTSLQQGTGDVSTYYTKLKSIWEELSGYKPSFPCTCGGLQHLQNYIESEYVMKKLKEKLLLITLNFIERKDPNVLIVVLDNPDSLNQNKSDNLTAGQCLQLINFLTDQVKLDNSVEALPPNVMGPQDLEEDWHC
ncbi:Retrotransposon gag domain [Sesbania bispinosa]|nr:Retrotransposon gag domain [Sesbania bispinosa]